MALAAPLAACGKALAQCRESMNALLPTLQAAMAVMVAADTAQPALGARKRAEQQEAHAHVCALTAALLAAQLRCGTDHLSSALVPLGLKTQWPQATLSLCARRAAARPELSALLLTLARQVPAALLDLDLADAAPRAWNMRWAFLAGSACDLALGTPAEAAPFWRALLDTSAAPECDGRLDLWGAGRAVDADAVAADSSGFVWASWLAAAMLSGLLPEELAACPQVVAHALAPPEATTAEAVGALASIPARLATDMRAALTAAREDVRRQAGAVDAATGPPVACAAVLSLLAAAAAPAACTGTTLDHYVGQPCERSEVKLANTYRSLPGHTKTVRALDAMHDQMCMTPQPERLRWQCVR